MPQKRHHGVRHRCPPETTHGIGTRGVARARRRPSDLRPRRDRFLWSRGLRGARGAWDPGTRCPGDAVGCRLFAGGCLLVSGRRFGPRVRRERVGGTTARCAALHRRGGCRVGARAARVRPRGRAPGRCADGAVRLGDHNGAHRADVRAAVLLRAGADVARGAPARLRTFCAGPMGGRRRRGHGHAASDRP
jgi:hypothetical protein